MSYNYTIRIEVPATQAEVAAKIGAALDPDSGGTASWDKTIIGYTQDKEPQPIYGDTIFVSTPCEKEFAEQVPVLLANPPMLHAMVLADSAARPGLWEGETPPTLAEVESFCASVIPTE